MTGTKDPTNCGNCQHSGPVVPAEGKHCAEVRCVIWTQVQKQWAKAIGESWRPVTGWCPCHDPAGAKKGA